MKILFLFIVFFSFKSHSFILVYKSGYQVKDHTHASVRIAPNSCSGIPSSQLKSVVKEAIDEYWNTVSESELKLYYDKSISASSIDNTTRSGSIVIGCAPFGSSGANGITNTTKSSGQSVIRVNDSTFQPGGYSRDALLNVIIHEMGHALGLHHSKDKASVMTYESHDWGGVAPNYLSQDDRDGIVYLYPQDPELAGLLGGCQILENAFASQDSSIFHSLSYLINYLFGFLFIFFVRRIFIKSKN